MTNWKRRSLQFAFALVLSFLVAQAIRSMWDSSSTRPASDLATAGSSESSHGQVLVARGSGPIRESLPDDSPQRQKADEFERAVLKDVMGDIPSGRDPQRLEIPSEDLLLSGSVEKILADPYFQQVIPSDVLKSADFRNRFSLALSELRREYRVTLERRDSLTGVYVARAMMAKNARTSSEQGPDELGAYVTGPNGERLWVAVPVDDPAHREQEKLIVWRASSALFLSKIR